MDGSRFHRSEKSTSHSTADASRPIRHQRWRRTERIGDDVRAVAAGSGDYVLDNISNTLAVADSDAAVAKRLFVFLGVPGGLLAAMLAAYAGTVLADAQRREQAMLRIRGASRHHLLRMLAMRTALLTAAGSASGLISGYVLAAAILGRESLDRANPSSLATSALLGTMSGFFATGLALYVTGRRSIDREINEDRARLDLRKPLWRRARLDVVGIVVILVATLIAIRAYAFAGAPGSVYFGRSVDLNLTLLALPVLVWIAGSLLAARIIISSLARTRPTSTDHLGQPLPSLYRRSIGRRPWAISNAESSSPSSSPSPPASPPSPPPTTPPRSRTPATPTAPTSVSPRTPPQTLPSPPPPRRASRPTASEPAHQ